MKKINIDKIDWGSSVKSEILPTQVVIAYDNSLVFVGEYPEPAGVLLFSFTAPSNDTPGEDSRALVGHFVGLDQPRPGYPYWYDEINKYEKRKEYMGQIVTIGINKYLHHHSCYINVATELQTIKDIIEVTKIFDNLLIWFEKTPIVKFVDIEICIENELIRPFRTYGPGELPVGFAPPKYESLYPAFKRIQPFLRKHIKELKEEGKWMKEDLIK